MPRQNVIQTNFTSGEVSPHIAGRVDAKVYANGARTVSNFIVKPQGGACRRGGTQIIGPTKHPDKTALLAEFIFSDIQGYVLEFGHQYIRFHKDGEPLLETTTEETDSFTETNNGGLMQLSASNVITDPPSFAIATISITSSVATVTTVRNHTLRVGAKVWIRSTGLVGVDDAEYTVLANPTAKVFRFVVVVANTSAATGEVLGHFCLPGDRIHIEVESGTGTFLDGYHFVKSVENYHTLTLANVAYSSVSFGGEEMHTIPIEVETTYTYLEVGQLQFAQSADTIYIFHPDHPVRKLTRLDTDGDHNDWLLSDVTFVDGPYMPLNDLAPTVDTTTPANGSRFNDVYMEISGYAHTATIATAPKVITNVANNGVNLYRITSAGHSLVTGNRVVISGTGTTADGNWVVTVITVDTFDLQGSTFGSTASTGTARAAFATADDSRYIEYKEGDEWRLAQLPSTMSDNDVTATVTIIDNIFSFFDETTRLVNRSLGIGGANSLIFAQLQAGNSNPSIRRAVHAAAGVLTSNYANTFSTQDIGKYIRYVVTGSTPTPNWAQITGIRTSGTEAHHGTAVTMATINNAGSFIVTNHSRAATLKSFRAGSAFAAFASTDVGRSFRLGWGGRWTWGRITAFTSTSVVTVALQEDMPRDKNNAANLAGAQDGSATAAQNSGRTYDWRLGSFSATTKYPSTGCFHEQRLMLARTDTQPATFWGSVTGDYENFAPTELDSTVLDDNGLTFTLVSGRINAIKWMESGTHLVIGTNGGEWLVRSASINQEPISPSNIQVHEQSRNGSSVLALPLRIGSSIVFVNRSERTVMEVAYLFSEDRLADKDLTVVSEHIIRQGGIAVRSAFQQNPNAIAWYLLSDGTLAALSYNADQEVIAWHRHTVTSATIESIAAVPSSDGTNDSVHVLCKRLVNPKTITSVANDGSGLALVTVTSHGIADGTWVNVTGTGTNIDDEWFLSVVTANTFLLLDRDGNGAPFETSASTGTVTTVKRSVERITPEFYPSGSSRLGMTFLDACRVIEDFSGTVITGLFLLEGLTVQVTGNGTKLAGTYTVASGSITIPQAYDEVVVGLGYTSTLKSLPPEGGSANGTSQGMKKRIHEMKVRVANSLGMQAGVAASPATYDFSAMLGSETTLPFFTGTVPVVPGMPWDIESPWSIVMSDPYPLNVLAVVSVMETTQ